MGSGLSHVAESAHLVDRAFDECLSAKPGIDAHDADEVEVAEHLLDGVQGSVGIQGHARFHARFPDGAQCPVEVGASLGVNGQDGGIEVGKVLDVAVGLLDHQVYIEGLARVSADGGDDGHAIADVGHERPSMTSM